MTNTELISAGNRRRNELSRTDEASAPDAASITIGLNAAIICIRDGNPHIFVTRANTADRSAPAGLPFGPFTPLTHRTFEIGLRSWVRDQAGLELGYVEQLYSFGDRGRHAQPGDRGPHVVSIGYLALTRNDGPVPKAGGAWLDIYAFFPWEDWRAGKPAVLETEIEPRLQIWATQPEPLGAPTRPLTRSERLKVYFGADGAWDEDKVLERYELLYEAGLIGEAARDGRDSVSKWPALPQLGLSMQYDHRRILGTAISRLRAKIKYRPVIFELMPEDFTLYELQKTVEAIFGRQLHKQNFRRLVETTRLVEPTQALRTSTGGRPAQVYRFRREVLLERPSSGLRFKGGKP